VVSSQVYYGGGHLLNIVVRFIMTWGDRFIIRSGDVGSLVYYDVRNQVYDDGGGRFIIGRGGIVRIIMIRGVRFIGGREVSGLL
jgi:hypothetical protein